MTTNKTAEDAPHAEASCVNSQVVKTRLWAGFRKNVVTVVTAFAAIVFGQRLLAVDIENASSGPVVPGEWNTNFTAAKTYAEQNGIPLLLFWSNPGCAQCNKMKTACNTSTFVNWRKAKQIVLVISEGDATSKAFAKNSSGKYPYMRVYWPAGSVDVRFSGRSAMIPASGSTLEAQLINYLNSLLKNWTPGGVTPSQGGGETVVVDDTPGTEWNRARKLYGCITNANGVVAGRIVVAAGKMNAKKKIAKIKVQIQDLNGKVKTLGSKNFTVKGTTIANVSGRVGSANLSIKGSALSGSVVFGGTAYGVSNVAPGGSIANGTLYFSLDSYPVSCQGYPVIGGTAFLPVSQRFTSANSKWSFARSGTLRYNRQTSQFVMSSMDNPSGLKLTYVSSTGYFKGKFTVYVSRNGRSARKYTATVGGFMVNGKGSGQVTIRNVGTYACSISPDSGD